MQTYNNMEFQRTSETLVISTIYVKHRDRVICNSKEKYIYGMYI